MATLPPRDVTGLLLAWRGGDAAALDRLIPLVYGELHRLARHRLRGERPDHTLPPTALVHELFIKLVDIRRIAWQDRSHFLAVCARLMRRLLVDAARRRRAGKRSGGTRTVALDPDRIVANQPPNLAALDLALDALAREDPRKARVVELRFFGGLSVDETAAVLGVSADTVGRDWKFARAWLRRAMQATPPAHV